MKCLLTLRTDVCSSKTNLLPTCGGFYYLTLGDHKYVNTTCNLRRAVEEDLDKLLASSHEDNQLQRMYRADAVIEVDYTLSDIPH